MKPIIAAIGCFIVISPAWAGKPTPVLIKLSYVGDPGNRADVSGTAPVGAVSYDYSIGTYDVTIAQYTAFLNAVARWDTFNLYDGYLNSPFFDSIKGIKRSGTQGAYTYSVIGNGQNPVTFVSWLDAARFCNWLQNGQPTTGAEDADTTENGAYLLNGDTISGTETAVAGASWRLPTENEWYKAAYYDPTKSGTGGYWLYATRSDSTPGNNYRTGGRVTNQANYVTALLSGPYSVTQKRFSMTQNYLSPVGSFSKSPSYYGTFDQSGDVFQLNDAMIVGSSGTLRQIRGGSWDVTSSYMMSSYTDARLPTGGGEKAGTGFRVASKPAINPAGEFTLLLTAADKSTGIPQGIGWATLTASKGKAAISGKLPDGEAFSVSGAAIFSGSTGNEIVIEVPLTYPSVTKAGSKGSLAFAEATGTTSDLVGTLAWVKPPQKSSVAYPGQIDTNLGVIGSLYERPGKGESALPGFLSGTLELSDTGALSVSATTQLVQAVTLNSKNALVVTKPATDNVAISLRVANGVFTGSFIYPGQKSKRPPATAFSGVLFQDQTLGAGFFVGPDGGGTITLSTK